MFFSEKKMVAKFYRKINWPEKKPTWSPQKLSDEMVPKVSGLACDGQAIW